MQEINKTVRSRNGVRIPGRVRVIITSFFSFKDFWFHWPGRRFRGQPVCPSDLSNQWSAKLFNARRDLLFEVGARWTVWRASLLIVHELVYEPFDKGHRYGEIAVYRG